MLTDQRYLLIRSACLASILLNRKITDRKLHLSELIYDVKMSGYMTIHSIHVLSYGHFYVVDTPPSSCPMLPG